MDETINLSGEDVLYDDFFSDPDDEGVEAVIEHKGKMLTFRLKKSLTLAEKQRAADASLGFELSPDGTPKITKMDQSAYTQEVVLAGVKSWPFRYSNHRKIAEHLRGTPVPINRYSVSRMDGTLAEKVAAVILGQREAQQKALDPFEQKSDVAS